MKIVLFLVSLNVFVVLAFSVAFGQTVYYGNRSNLPQQFIYMDGKGNYAGTSIQTGNTIEYLDANGNLAGIANTTPPLSTPSGGYGDE